MPLTDEELLAQVAAGGREAYVALYDRFAPRVFGLLVKLIPNRTEAEDVLQEVMWEIWRKAGRYDATIGSAQTWILLTARSRAIDAVRRMRRLSELAEGAGQERRGAIDDGEATAPASVLGAALGADADGPLAGAMSCLPDEQETAIRLAFVHGLTRQEIAEAMGVPIGTVKTRISLGIKKLGEAAVGRGVGA